jgi:hypothetical protein
MPEPDDNQLMWLEEDGEEANAQQDQASVQAVQRSITGEKFDADLDREALSTLEAELQRTRRELMDVRKELAAKVLLSWRLVAKGHLASIGYPH